MGHLISLGESKDKRGGGATAIIESLTKHEIGIDELTFQSYDYAANMSGWFKWVQKELQDKLQKEIPYILCLAH